MPERPILFSGPMVRAILAGTKTQTRRLVTDATTQGNWKASELDLSTAWVDPGPSPVGNPGPYLKARPTRAAMIAHEWPPDDDVMDRLYPRWFPGDRLWVRETWTAPRRATGEHEQDRVLYRADSLWDGCGPGDLGFDWSPSIFMPRWASRLTLEITAVRVQRLQEISDEDAAAEGAALHPGSFPLVDGPRRSLHGHAFADLWDAINAKRAPWASNPWVWALTFHRATP